jgi:opacity protein-like surface antigen
MDMTIRGLTRRFLGTALALAFAIPGQSMAADIDAIPEKPVTVVEYGSGWYLRGDVGVNFHGPFDDTGVSEENLSNNAPLNASMAVGYTFNDYFRMEGELGFVGNYSFSNSFTTNCSGYWTELDVFGNPDTTFRNDINCEGNDDGQNSLWEGMVNAYLDLGRFGGFRPYVGGGLGFLYSSYSGSVNNRNCEDFNVGDVSFVCAPDNQVDYEFDDTSVSLLWSLAGGFAYDIDENWAVDVGYRYLSASEATYLSSAAGSPGEATGVSVQQVRVGLRYTIW